MTYQQIIHGGKVWVEVDAAHEAQRELSKTQGVVDTQAKEIAFYRATVGAGRVLSERILAIQENLEQQKKGREKPILQVGWCSPDNKTCCSNEEMAAYPDLRIKNTVRVYVIEGQ